MRNILLISLLFFFGFESWGACTSPISRTNNTSNQVLTSTKYNLDLNTAYSKINDLSGDCITDATVATAKLVDASVTTAKLAAEVVAKFIPSGVIMPFGGTVAPTGFFLCDGTAVSRVTYADLYAVIGTSFGSGNGSTTFNLPDFRGRFLRGVDGAVGRDEGRTTRTAMNAGGNAGDLIGSVQLEDFKTHAHTFATGAGDGGGYANSSGVIARSANTSGTFSDYVTVTSGGNETRPDNANVQFIIKY